MIYFLIERGADVNLADMKRQNTVQFEFKKSNLASSNIFVKDFW